MSSRSLSHEDAHGTSATGLTQRFAQWLADLRGARPGPGESRRSEVERELHSLFGSASAGRGDDA